VSNTIHWFCLAAGTVTLKLLRTGYSSR